MKEIDYWNERSKICYKYKGEKFYTITPIPYYYKRREIVIKLLYQQIRKSGAVKVCDYGCGDGEYIDKLIAMGLDCQFDGIDYSHDFISRAEELHKRSDNIKFMECDGRGINNNEKYDVIFSSAVFAHMDDLTVKTILNSFVNNLLQEGCVMFCEQVGKKWIDGDTFVRRTIHEYNDFLEDKFFIEKVFLIDYWFHRLFFERWIAKIFYNYICNGDNMERRIQANKMKIFRAFSSVCTFLSYPHVFPNAKNGWGYALFIARMKP